MSNDYGMISENDVRGVIRVFLIDYYVNMGMSYTELEEQVMSSHFNNLIDKITYDAMPLCTEEGVHYSRLKDFFDDWMWQF